MLSTKYVEAFCNSCCVHAQEQKLSHETLIRRASSLVAISSNTYLSQTTLALVESLTEYTNVSTSVTRHTLIMCNKKMVALTCLVCTFSSQAINTLMTLHTGYIANINKLNPAQEESLWQMIVSKRQEVKAQ